uniref:RRM domain-containing protein n=2 Tax=Meloidogyne TaxID=189290 RepID=A0A915LH10_MELJA
MTEINYEKAHLHWSSVTSNVDGMLGGFEQLHSTDINTSKQLLDYLIKKQLLTKFEHALDCASGIGRITKYLLLPKFNFVDMFIEQSKEYIGTEGNSRVQNKFVESLHTFKPNSKFYDLIWIQWVTGQLSDDDLTNFLRRCKKGLTKNGCIIIKDNVTSRDEERIFDECDSSWTRPSHELRPLIEAADLNIVLERKQLFFPKNNFPSILSQFSPKSKKEKMTMSRVYIGNLSSRVTDRELEHFFRGFGKIRDVMLKNGFGFVEFDDHRDAEDAVYELNGRELCGHRVVVEISHRSQQQQQYRSGMRSRDGRVNGRFPPPRETRHRMRVTNLSTRFSWQDLKDMMRDAGEVTYADAHKRVRNEALVCFATHDDLRRAMDRFQGKEINGRRIKLIDDSYNGGGRRSYTRSRSRSPRSRSRSRSYSNDRRSTSARSRSPPPEPSRSRSTSPVPAKNADDAESIEKRSRSRSASVGSEKN